MKVLMYADFCKLIPTTKFVVDLLDKDISESTLLFVPLATDNKVYIGRCFDALIKLGFRAENIRTASPVIGNEHFDAVFVCGGNNAILKEKLLNWNLWDKLKTLIINNTLYIGDSAGAVILGKAFDFSLTYEPYNGKLTDFSGLNIIDKYVIVHYSTVKMRSDGTICDAIDYFNKHQIQVEELGRENCLTIGNNELFKITDDDVKLYTFNWDEIQENYKREL